MQRKGTGARIIERPPLWQPQLQHQCKTEDWPRRRIGQSRGVVSSASGMMTMMMPSHRNDNGEKCEALCGARSRISFVFRPFVGKHVDDHAHHDPLVFDHHVSAFSADPVVAETLGHLGARDLVVHAHPSKILIIGAAQEAATVCLDLVEDAGGEKGLLGLAHPVVLALHVLDYVTKRGIPRVLSVRPSTPQEDILQPRDFDVLLDDVVLLQRSRRS
mmetsp:Transcript_5219/g.15270  ORF Transcript_5219/g.15270 Transcript_5219/m.15270 type:complete len:217 (-) Transcript_5219:505-1155(-)